MKWVGMILMTALLIGAPGYARAEAPGKDTASPAARSVKSYAPEEKQAYQKKVAADLEKIQQGINELKVKGRTVIQQKKRMVLKTLMALQNQAYAARNKLAGLEKAPENAWSSLKADMDKTMGELDQVYKEVEALIQ